MKSVLEELYYGNIRPFANRREVSEEKQKVLQKMEDYRDRLLDSLSAEQKHLLEEYENCASEITSKTECEIFIDGYRLGMRFVLELFELKCK